MYCRRIVLPCRGLGCYAAGPTINTQFSRPAVNPQFSLNSSSTPHSRECPFPAQHGPHPSSEHTFRRLCGKIPSASPTSSSIQHSTFNCEGTRDRVMRPLSLALSGQRHECGQTFAYYSNSSPTTYRDPCARHRHASIEVSRRSTRVASSFALMAT